MVLGEGIDFLEHCLSCGMFGKWTAKEKLFQAVLSRTVSHEHHELCIVSKMCNIANRVLRGLKFFVRSRLAPAKFEPAPHPQEFEKSCPHPHTSNPTRTRPALFRSQTRTCPKITKNS